MAQATLIIDNTGFDIEAMSAITEQEFIDIHKNTDVICRNKSLAEKVKWLKAAYKSLKVAAAPVKEKKPGTDKEI